MPAATRAVECLLLLAVGVGVVAPGEISGQEGHAVPELRRTLESLGDSARVRLLAPGLVVSDGVFLGFRHDSLQVAEADAVLVVGLDEIEGFSVEGNRWLGLAIQAAGVGLVGGFMAGYMKGSYECRSEPDVCDGVSWRTGVNWSVTGGMVGAALGAAVGLRMPRWRSVFP